MTQPSNVPFHAQGTRLRWMDVFNGCVMAVMRSFVCVGIQTHYWLFAAFFSSSTFSQKQPQTKKRKCAVAAVEVDADSHWIWRTFFLVSGCWKKMFNKHIHWHQHVKSNLVWQVAPVDSMRAGTGTSATKEAKNAIIFWVLDVVELPQFSFRASRPSCPPWVIATTSTDNIAIV